MYNYYLIFYVFVKATAFWRRYLNRKKELEQRDFDKQLPLLHSGPSSLGSSERRHVQPWDNPAIVEHDWILIPQRLTPRPRSLAERSPPYDLI